MATNLPRVQSMSDQSWAVVRDRAAHIQAWAEDESNDPVIRGALMCFLGELHMRPVREEQVSVLRTALTAIAECQPPPAETGVALVMLRRLARDALAWEPSDVDGR